jgi:hypothetical protein
MPKDARPIHSCGRAGEHREMHNRSLVNRRVLDWLDETLGVTS